MINLYRVDFIKGKTDAADYGQVKHSLIDTATDRQIISLSVSADKLQSISNYSREPKRLTFECFPTTWITNNILSGGNEHERYISHLEVKVYRNNSLFFTGIIDTSQLSLDVSTGILKFTCYDKIKLLSVYSDLTHYYSLTAGYQPSWILGYFLQDIEQTIPISIPYSNLFSLPTLYISSGNAITIAHVDYNDMLQFPNPPGGWTYSYHNTSWLAPKYGYWVDTISNRVIFLFAFKKIIQATYPNPATTKYQGRYRGRILKFYNNICPVVQEYDEKTGWEDSITALDNAYNELLSFFNDNGISEAQLNNLTSTGSLGDAHYGSSQLVNTWVEADFYGNLMPPRLHPGKSYETLKTEQTDNLKVLQAMLMLYNATLYTHPSGNIIFKNKDSYSSTIIDIAEEDVVTFITKRGNQEKPDTAVLDVLAGDTSQLQGLIRSYLMDFYDAKWSIEATIDQLAKYNLSLQGKIMIKNKVYVITELERNYQSDEYKLKAWLI